MKAIPAVLLLAAALLTSPGVGPAAADDVPTADCATLAPLWFDAADGGYQFHGLPQSLVQGREATFRVTRSDVLNTVTGVDVTVTGDRGDVVLSGVNAPLKQTYSLAAGSDDSVLTVTAVVHVHSDDVPLGADYETVTWGPIDCTSTITADVAALPGRTLPHQPALTRDWGGSQAFKLFVPRACAATYEPSPVEVSVRAKGSARWLSVRSTDECFGWDAQIHSTSFALTFDWLISSEHNALQFTPHTPATNNTRYYQYRLSRLSSPSLSPKGVLLHGEFKVVTTHVPPRRVYAWNGWNVNDEYWNYCVNNGKQTWMDHGNAYCVRPGSTTRTVTRVAA